VHTKITNTLLVALEEALRLMELPQQAVAAVLATAAVTVVQLVMVLVVLMDQAKVVKV
jgi:hypothetical protein